ncbi:unnamed protein product [Nippostrongylus brasiliensis]|uniref:Uncharacterized protein n=1 Tax=Nippostrongylus brasiliensis TaxID=27835 RepID=A0A0N4Y2Q0_NIPBR|nr:unnamed protein product [Nippostrongylus brasiliensis]
MLLSNAVTQAKKKYWESDTSSISFVAPNMSPRSAEKRVRVLEEAIYRNGELKRQLFQADEDCRANLRKKSATFIAWQNAYDELKENHLRLKSRHRRKVCLKW